MVDMEHTKLNQNFVMQSVLPYQLKTSQASFWNQIKQANAGFCCLLLATPTHSPPPLCWNLAYILYNYIREIY
jgi:hypothetical protein